MLKPTQKGERILFVLLFLTYSFFYQGASPNVNSRFDLTLALSLEHRLTIDSFHENTIDKVYYKGHYYSEKAPGSSYLATLLPLLASPWITTQTLIRKPWVADFLLYLATVFSVSFISALSSIFFRRLLFVLNPAISTEESFLFTLLTYIATPIFPYSTLLLGHQLAGSLLVMGLYSGLAPTHRPHHNFAFQCISSFCLGTAILCEYPAVLMCIGIVSITYLNSKNKKQFLKASLFGVIPLIVLMFHNWLIYRHPFSMGYGKLQETAFGEVMSKGFFGIQLPSPINCFQLLFGVYRGLFIYTPILFFAVAAIFYSLKTSHLKWLTLLMMSAAIHVLVISGYGYWQGGVSFGPRHLVPIIPFLALGFAYLPKGYSKTPLFLLISGVSVGINLMGTAITPYVNEWDSSPLFNSYFELIRAGVVAINPVNFLTPAWLNSFGLEGARNGTLAAFNLGQFLGFTGWASVAVMLFIWIPALFYFYSLRDSELTHRKDALSPRQVSFE